MALTTAQVLLLNNLMYYFPSETLPFKESVGNYNRTVEDIINNIDTGAVDLSYTSKKDVEQILDTIRADETLLKVEMVSTYVDKTDNGGGMGALFTDPSSNEAIVVFKGTQGGSEWKDNFTAGAEVSSAQQESALDWYQSLDLEDYDTVTVSGHSKGGNKAQYITVMDNSVDRCLSFDGQGFSDEFIEEYGDQILRNQSKIENHVVNYDPVNLLLNQIGTTKYYKGYGVKNPLENHCPNSFFDFKDDGTYELHETSRPAEMEAIDKFFNSYLRTLPDGEKQQLMDILGNVANSDDGTSILYDLFDGDNEDAIARLIAYTVKYAQQNPDFLVQVASYIGQYPALAVAGGLIIEAINIILACPGTRLIAMEMLAALLLSQGISIPEAAAFLAKIYGYLDEVEITDSGEDKKPQSSGEMGATSFVVNVNILKQAQELFTSVSSQINVIGDSVKTTAGNLPVCMFIIRGKTKSQCNNVMKLAEKCGNFANAMQEIYEAYEKTENNCMVVE